MDLGYAILSGPCTINWAIHLLMGNLPWGNELIFQWVSCHHIVAVFDLIYCLVVLVTIISL